MEEGGGIPNIKVTKQSERNNTTGTCTFLSLVNDWISGLSENNLIF